MKAVEDFEDLEITLIGDREKIAAHLTEHGRITVKHAEEVIEAKDER